MKHDTLLLIGSYLGFIMVGFVLALMFICGISMAILGPVYANNSIYDAAEYISSPSYWPLIIEMIILGLYGLICLMGAMLLRISWKTGQMGTAIAGSVLLTIDAVLVLNIVNLSTAILPLVAAALGWIGVARIGNRKRF